MAALPEMLIPAVPAERLAGFVLKARSPSCGLRDISRVGRGIFAKAVVRRYRGLHVIEEIDLRKPGSVESFLREASKR